jgi:nucleotide-binding universal stress UspA family protein
MYQYKRILVALDLTNNDIPLFHFLNHICSKLKIDRVYFIHITKTLEWPPEIIKKYPDILAPVDENIHHIIETQISKHLNKPFYKDAKILVQEGTPEEALLREVNIKEIDLLVMGKKAQQGGSGRIARRMANLAQCSVALISNSFLKAIEKKPKLMVSVDFNESSLNAARMAEVVRKANDAWMVVHHVYHVPSGYHYSGKSYDEFADIMKKNANEKMDKLIKQCKIDDSKSKKILKLDKQNNIVKKIGETADEENVQLIVVGSKGRTKPASIFLGSTAEKLTTKTDKNILIVKDKKSNLALLDYLMDV